MTAERKVLRILTPGTAVHADLHEAAHVADVEGGAIWQNGRGFSGVSLDIWVGYYESAKMAQLAFAMAVALQMAHNSDRGT